MPKSLYVADLTVLAVAAALGACQRTMPEVDVEPLAENLLRECIDTCVQNGNEATSCVAANCLEALASASQYTEGNIDCSAFDATCRQICQDEESPLNLCLNVCDALVGMCENLSDDDGGSGPTTPEVLSTAQPPTVDGVVDPIWQSAKAHGAVKVIDGQLTGQADLGAQWRGLWDPTHLYLLVEVVDDVLVKDSGPTLYADDTVEVFLDADNTQRTTYGQNDFQYLFRYQDPAVAAGTNSDPNVSGIAFATGLVASGYLIEIAIPWTTLNVVPAHGHEFGIDIQVDDDDDGAWRDAKLSWAADDDTAWNDPSMFGQARLVNSGSQGNGPPVAVVTATPIHGQAPLRVVFDAQQSADSDGSIVLYSWDFGDGSSAAGIETQHTYASPGVYVARLTVTDDGGVTAVDQVSINASQSGALDNTDSPLGTNLKGITDYSSEFPFVDLMKTSRAWISGASGQWEDNRALDLDAHGWVRSLQDGQIARTLMLWDTGYEFPSGQFVVFYEGEGTIEYSAGAVKNAALSSPGRDVIDWDPSGGGINLSITGVNPDNYLRNIRVIVFGGVCSNDPFIWCQQSSDCGSGSCELFEDNYATQIFHPTFLERIRTYTVVRFMDWMRVNNSALERWADRPQVADARWSTMAGAPVEIMVALANRLHAEPWFCMPHRADDDFVRQFATLVRNTLDPGLRSYIEHSNEVWNGQFSQFDFAEERGRALGLGGDAFHGLILYHSQRSVEIFDIWTDVFGGLDRLVRVMGAWAVNTWVSEEVLAFQGASQKTDALAIAPYFGHDLSGGNPDFDTLMQQLEQELDPSPQAHPLSHPIGCMQEQAKVATAHGVELIAYEGGQHLTGSAEAYLDANRDPRMGEYYATYLDGWRQAGGRLFVHYYNCGRQGRSGSWGSLEYMFQPRNEAPKYNALQTFIETNPRWW